LSVGGLHKHGVSGKVHNLHHFTGRKASGTQRKRKSSRKQRRLNRGTAINKYKET